jgi:nucleoside-diphosphate-sugar epimerase
VPLTSAAADRLLGSLTANASALTRAVGFDPPYSVEKGRRMTVEWYLRREGAPA